MTTPRKLYERYAVWVTRWKNKVRTDPFYRVRLQLVGLYFVVGAIIFMILGWFLTTLQLTHLYEVSLLENGHPVQVAFANYKESVFIRRIILAILFAVGSYFVAEFALGPIRKAAELQKRFIATVSHELRTPLTIMKNAIEIALRKPENLTHDKAIALLKDNLQEVDRLAGTVQFLLVYSKLKSSMQTSDAQPTALAALARRAVALMQQTGAEHGVALELDERDPGVISGNATVLEGMFINLIKNAIAHTPHGGRVVLAIEKRASEIIISVRDTGSGIVKKDLPYIFEPFFRGSDEEKDEGTYRGFGLGLSIIKEIADFHKASITVATEEKKGTTFTIVFPAA